MWFFKKQYNRSYNPSYNPSYSQSYSQSDTCEYCDKKKSALLVHRCPPLLEKQLQESIIFAKISVVDAIQTENNNIINILERIENEIQRAELKTQLKENLEFIKTL